MADVFLLLAVLIVLIAGGFGVYCARVAAGRKGKARLQAARRTAMAQAAADAEYIRNIHDATTIEELERLAEKRGELWSCSYSPSSS
jgi:uncharacterized protein (UPF0333 family)